VAKNYNQKYDVYLNVIPYKKSAVKIKFATFLFFIFFSQQPLLADNSSYKTIFDSNYALLSTSNNITIINALMSNKAITVAIGKYLRHQKENIRKRLTPSST